ERSISSFVTSESSESDLPGAAIPSFLLNRQNNN
ncbi:MAG: hypothetical protein RLZZ32_772, partial [Cyanobacteriota bacterium]